ncbi:hypothetical protein AOXY_G238 [Acipenser oxyrinchus oxyrinchus]|uniref:DUF4537 domain-containing protein n=1 Tax=Acipenser oxyrinchus oxyrinchus TaxID=40147 RepID=A0AAD8GK81_ACIOX|nr:hypothetical protein AOXY_G238 [Acipenser oxyrinchus oxyrinchus]
MKKRVLIGDGERAVCRWEVDGFYYPATVTTLNQHKVSVCFNMGVKQDTAVCFVIPERACHPSPRLKVGDFVLVKEIFGARLQHLRFIPGFIVGKKFKSASSVLYPVMTYNYKKYHVACSDTIKISQKSYRFILKHMNEAQKLDHEIMFGPTQYIDRHESKANKGNVEHEDESEFNAYPSDRGENAAQMTQTTSLSGTIYSVESSPDYETSYFPTPLPSPPSSPPPTQDGPTGCEPQDTEDSKAEIRNYLLNVLEEQKKLVEAQKEMLNRLDQETSLCQAGLTLDQHTFPLSPGMQVLVQNPEDGWYLKGAIISEFKHGEYLVECNDNTTIKTSRVHLEMGQKEENNIKEWDHVLCLYPRGSGRYCPAVVLKVLSQTEAQVLFYDKTEGFIPQEEIYRIDNKQMERTVREITSHECGMFGRTVVARKDSCGVYNIGKIVRSDWHGPRYHLEWTDGSQSIQEAVHIFGQFSRQQELKPGSHVLALASAEPTSFIYLPGMVIDRGDRLLVQFCNGKRSFLNNTKLCYWLSEDYYRSSVDFYKRKQHKIL